MEQQRLWIAVVVAMAIVVLPFNCLAAEYTVGDSKNWDLGVNYTSWASGKTFVVGDKLVFTYSPSSHDLLVVNKAAYDSCASTNPLQSYTTGNDTITLNATGTHYYICGITGHCSGGMKLAVTVGAASTSRNGSAPSPSPTPAPSATPTPTPAKSPSPSSTTPSPTSPPPSSTTPTPPTVESPPPSPGTTTPSSPSPSSPANGANPPSGTTPSSAAPSYSMGGVLFLGASLLFAMASL